MVVAITEAADLDQLLGGVDEDLGDGGLAGVVVAEGGVELEHAVEVDFNGISGAGAAKAVPARVADVELGLYLVARHLLDFADDFAFARGTLSRKAICRGIGLLVFSKVVDSAFAANSSS